ncbi:Tn3 family transposase (plasmid) [Bacillus shihchuchen]|uniref:Tn3 family transposase n=1 Tax=Bacillus shihchuchen TaxID=3036942 RepID=A0ABT7KZ26_9BACI|nr:Tn3 family transposase [Bacillus shihchuchen]
MKIANVIFSFYTKVTNTNAKDAVHDISGLLHHESDLVIEEHYKDTAMPISRAEVCPNVSLSHSSLSKHEKNSPLPNQKGSGGRLFF